MNNETNPESEIHLENDESKTNNFQITESESDNKETVDCDQVSDKVERYTLSEQTAIVNNKHTQVVTLSDSRGQVLDQKQGQAGEHVILEMHGQAFSYEVQGPTESGEPITVRIYSLYLFVRLLFVFYCNICT